MQTISEKKVFQILEDYFKKYNFVNIQLESYDDFLNNGIKKIIANHKKMVVKIDEKREYIIKITNPFVDKPQLIQEDRTMKLLYPNEARLRDLNYESNLYIDIESQLIEKKKDNKIVLLEHNVHNKISIAKLPIMLRSSHCHLHNKTKSEGVKHGECMKDEGGYFIIKGKERVIVAQERINYNIVYIFEQKVSSKYKYVAEIRSMSEETGHSVLTQVKMNNKDEIVFSIPYIKQEIPAGIVFKALNFFDMDKINELIFEGDEDLLQFSHMVFKNSKNIKTKEEALKIIGESSIHIISSSKIIAYAEQVLNNELFPHLGAVTSNFEKVNFLCYMIRKLLLTCAGKRTEDNRDNVSNKRIETTGNLVYSLLNSLYKRFLKKIEQQLERRTDIILAISRTSLITQGLRHCFATGNWGAQKNAYMRTGVSQVLSRITYGATISHLRRIIIPIGKEGKNIKIRQIHPSQIGFICAVETPEGHSVGIVKNFSVMTTVTKSIPTVQVREVIETIDNITFIYDDDIEKENMNDRTKIFVNGVLIGLTEETPIVLRDIKEKKTNKLLHHSISISYDKEDDEIHIFSDEGRLSRPVFNVKDSKLLMTKNDELDWDKLVEQNKIVYIDTYESESSEFAMFPEELKKHNYDFCELHPSCHLGVVAGVIPFPDHTPSPRNTYQAAMGKQAIGMPLLTNDLRVDTCMHVMTYPQKPLVYTKYSEFLGYNDMPSGINAIVAIACYSGFNQEDSVILNKASVERGMFVCNTYKTINVEEKKLFTNYAEYFKIPDKDIMLRSYNYSKLNENGIVKKGSYVKVGDIIVSRVAVKIEKSGKEIKYDKSIAIKHGEEGYVDNIYETTTQDGYKLIKVKIRIPRIPEIGDKFASREAQKGTCGMILPQEDMPYTQDGIVPDIIINPHAIPSRMTINQLLECLGAKSGAIKGEFTDCTPFSSNSTNVMEKLCDRLRGAGFDENGDEVMYSGMTGEVLPSRIFIGPVYYQRLKHLVAEKMHARDFGNVQSLTRQPLEGRSRDGGLRFGEMERDCMISHGVSNFIKERLYDMSDPFSINVCEECNNIPNFKDSCGTCKTKNVKTVRIPYACKLLFQELMTMGIRLKINV